MKKFLTLLLTVALTAALAITGTMAYLTDTDSDVNVMTMGNVYIDQIEQERDVNGELVDFTQAKPLLPAVYPGQSTTDSIPWADAADWAVAGDEAWKTVEGGAEKNVVDKFVTVENTGKSDAYVRTIIAYEGDPIKGTDIHIIQNAKDSSNTEVSSKFASTEYIENVVIDGVRYDVIVYTYAAPLAPGATTIPSLKQVYMDHTCGNEEVEKYGETYEILVLSQAVQTDGFADATTALNDAFGPVTAANAAAWFGEMYIPDYTIAPIEPVSGEIVLVDGEERVLVGGQEPVKVSGEGTLYLRDLTINAASGSAITVDGDKVKLVVENTASLTAADDAINVPAGAKLDLSGNGEITAIGGGGADSADGGNGIGGEGAIYIHDLNNLIAEGNGLHAFGIGGKSAEIKIENTNIEYVKGGYVQPNFINDTKYGKSEPEGGAAIGSETDGAVITLTNVVIEKAEGGSKAAAIGAEYHVGVTINITGCDIKDAQGGNASAAIGGSRVAQTRHANDDITINIHDSKVNAKGGEYGAGIGSGYDTHCGGTSGIQPLHTINITGNSVINATGGKYAAGIGTGFHVGSLDGKIDATVTVTAVSGEKFYKNTYTQAQDIGFGVVDPTREGKDSTYSLDYQGTEITLPSI